MIVQDAMQYLSQLDPEVGASVQEEFARQQRNIELIASENIVSPAVMVAMGTCLTNKYAEGYPGHRYYGGCFAVDVTEELARQRACQLFGCKYANVQPHSGAQANLAVYFALLDLGDTVMGQFFIRVRPAVGPRVFTDAVEDDDGFVHGVADDGQDGRQEGRIDFQMKEREEAQDHDQVVQDRH